MTTTSSFSDFTNKLFCHEVTRDSITLAYHLRNPDAYHIPSLPVTLSSFSMKDYEKNRRNSNAYQTIDQLITKLNKFSTESLSESEQFDYALIQQYLTLTKSLSKYPYYEELLGASNGVQANLPVTLCEYPLTDKASIETYLQLLEQIPDYFDNIIAYETKRNDLGYTTPAFITSSTKEQVQTFLKSLKQNDNCFSSTFTERIAQIDSISDSDRHRYEKQNTDAITRSILPAYETLYDYLDVNPAHTSPSIETDISYGLTTLPHGKDYYSYLVQRATGSNHSVSELITLTDNTLQNALSTVLNIALTDQTTYLYYCDHPLESYYESPETILEALSLMIREEYPVLSPKPQYTVKNVPESLASSLSPAFYMIPAMDDYNNNTIYINPLYTNEENGNLFTTLAHEGFPGHLYQTVYFNTTNPNPIRHILDFPGYVEGWATYVEMNAFTFLDYPLEGDSLCRLYQNDTIINLALCSRIDLGVNYEGWTLDDTRQFFEKNGFRDYYAEDIYFYVVEAPANYLSYLIGYLEIEDIKTSYQNLKMEEYSEKEFHKALLDIGPADFDTIRNYLLPTTASDES